MRAAEIDIRAANLIRLPLSDSPGTKPDVHHNRLWSMPNQPQLTARGASLMGVVFIAFSLIPILGRLRAIRVQPTDGTPGWVAICAGLGFLFAGAGTLATVDHRVSREYHSSTRSARSVIQRFGAPTAPAISSCSVSRCRTSSNHRPSPSRRT